MSKRNRFAFSQKKLGLFIGLIPILFMLVVCQQKSTQNVQKELVKQPKETAVEPTKKADPISDKLNTMTLKQKILQMFIVEPEVITGSQTTTGKGLQKKLQNAPVGGFIFMGSNIQDPVQLMKMTRELNSAIKTFNGIPLFLSIDEEGGSVARIGNNHNFQVPKIQSMSKIGSTGDEKKAQSIGSTIGKYLSEYDINLDFAPDADVLTNAKNQVIGSRSFGKDAGLVSRMVLAECNGLMEQNVLPCIKHFPGHGATEGDTHLGFAITRKTLEQLRKSELVPFEMAVKEKLPFIMVSHISVPAVTGSEIPSSLSHKMITGVLRGELGYEGIVITDAMNMGAIQKNYSPEDAAVKAIKAGVDIILMPQDFSKAYSAVLKAVQTGEISEKRIDKSVRRILAVKYK